MCARCVDPAVASSAASATAVGSRSRVSEAKKGSFAQFRQRLSAAASAPAAEAEIKASSEQTAPRLGTQTDGVSPVATAPQLTDAATSIPVVSEPVSSDADRRQRAAHLCFSVVARLPQPALDAVRNVWIVKPGIGSRGEGTLGGREVLVWVCEVLHISFWVDVTFCLFGWCRY